MVKERKKERKEKKIQPASITSDDVTAKRFSRGLIKKGWRGEGCREGGQEGEETACAILSKRESSSGLATPDVGLKKTSYLRLSASAFHLSDFIYSLGYSAINRASRLFKWNV